MDLFSAPLSTDWSRPVEPITVDEVKRAIRIAGWHLRESIRIARNLELATSGAASRVDSERVAADLIARSPDGRFTAREYCRRTGSNILTATAALSRLTASGFLIATRTEAGPNGGHPTTHYTSGRRDQ